MIYFYSILTSGPYFPAASVAQELDVALLTALSATVVSSLTWIWPFLKPEKFTNASVVLWTFGGTLAAGVCYALVVWKFDLCFKPDVFFRETDFLSFVFEVAPSTAVGAGVSAKLSLLIPAETIQRAT